MKQNQGQRANKNGKVAENVIASILDDKGYIYRRQYAFGIGIFGKPIRMDFYLPAMPIFPQGLAIESKWQQVSGSADEKLPALVANIQSCYPCPVIVMADGRGARVGAIGWLRSQVGGNLYAVLTLGEFLTWANRTL